MMLSLPHDRRPRPGPDRSRVRARPLVAFNRDFLAFTGESRGALRARLLPHGGGIAAGPRQQTIKTVRRAAA
jgi:hypothetical protein